MKRIAYLFVLAVSCLVCWSAWQKYGFLFDSIEAVDVADIVMEDRQVGSNEPMDLDFLNDGENTKVAPLDLGFLTEQQDTPVATGLHPDSLVADFLGTEPLDSVDLHAANPICIFDPVGQGGDIAELIKGFKSLALDRGVNLNIKNFNSETVIIDSFKAGQCDAIAVTGMQARPFNKFTASLEAVGGIVHYSDLKTVLEYLTQPENAHYMQQGEYEVAAIIPVGSVYAFVHDGAWSKNQPLMSQFQGKKVGVFESEKSSLEIIRQLGGTPVMVNSTSFAGKFNSGAVDIIFSPAVAYQPLELYRGLAENGRIVRQPLIQLTYQLIIRHEKFPPEFANMLRQAAYNGRGFAMEYVHLTEKNIPQQQWFTPSAEDATTLENVLLDAQQKLLGQDVYDKNMLGIMRRARCQRRPSHAECSAD